jgi:hypothetical protein
MKRITTIIILLINIFSCSDKEVKNKNCYSKTNYEIIHNYIQSEIETENLSYFTDNDYNIYLIDKNEIVINKKNSMIGKIIKDKGIISVAKNKSDNERLKIEMNNLFCELTSKIRLEKK